MNDNEYGVRKDYWIIELVGGPFYGIASPDNKGTFGKAATIEKKIPFEEMPETLVYRGTTYKKSHQLCSVIFYKFKDDCERTCAKRDKECLECGLKR